MKSIHLTSILLTAGLLLSSCNFPGAATETPGAESTSAAETVAAVLTSAADATAQAGSAGPTATQPLATPPADVTPTPTPACDDSVSNTSWTRDGALYDVNAVNTPLPPNEPFLMAWILQNTGSCTWDDSYELSYETGTELTESPSFAILQPGQTAAPGESVTVEVEMTAPAEAGDYQATWGLHKTQGEDLISFGIMLKVGSGSSGALARPGALAYTYECTPGAVNIDLSWSDAANNEDGYRILRDGNQVADLASGSTTYSENVPGPGTYVYTVAAYNTGGEASTQVTVNTSNCE